MLVLHISEIKLLFHKLPSPDSQVINPLVCIALKIYILSNTGERRSISKLVLLTIGEKQTNNQKNR